MTDGRMTEISHEVRLADRVRRLRRAAHMVPAEHLRWRTHPTVAETLREHVSGPVVADETLNPDEIRLEVVA